MLLKSIKDALIDTVPHPMFVKASSAAMAPHVVALRHSSTYARASSAFANFMEPALLRVGLVADKVPEGLREEYESLTLELFRLLRSKFGGLLNDASIPPHKVWWEMVTRDDGEEMGENGIKTSKLLRRAKDTSGFEYPVSIKLSMRALSVALAPAWIWARLNRDSSFTPEDKEKILGLVESWDGYPASEYLKKEEVIDEILAMAIDRSVPTTQVLTRAFGVIDRLVDTRIEDKASRVGELRKAIMGEDKGWLRPEIKAEIEKGVEEINNVLVKGLCELARVKK